MDDLRQYVCEKCKRFWFLSELLETRLKVKEGESIPHLVCPHCGGKPYYAGKGVQRGFTDVFGCVLAEMEYVYSRCKALGIIGQDGNPILEFKLASSIADLARRLIEKKAG